MLKSLIRKILSKKHDGKALYVRLYKTSAKSEIELADPSSYSQAGDKITIIPDYYNFSRIGGEGFELQVDPALYHEQIPMLVRKIVNKEMDGVKTTINMVERLKKNAKEVMSQIKQ